jgi:hypothetical protein
MSICVCVCVCVCVCARVRACGSVQKGVLYTNKCKRIATFYNTTYSQIF